MPSPSDHDHRIADQFTRQAVAFAGARALHSAAALQMLVAAACPKPSDLLLDVACGPGTVAIEFARHLRHATGLDTTEAMLDEARKLAARGQQRNVTWSRGDVSNLPFETSVFDIVSCRFAVHHFANPAAAFSEMARVCRPGGRIVLCDAVVSDDPAKAAAFNAMERLRDPSTVEFRTLAFLTDLFRQACLLQPHATYYQLPVEMEALLKTSFPAGDDRDGVRALLRGAVDGDRLGANARATGDTICFDYSAVILVATKP